jgi:uncharacterized membrane protein
LDKGEKLLANIKSFKIFLFIISLVILASILVPGTLWAQEQEENAVEEIEEITQISESLTTEVVFNEVVDYGIIGTTFEWRVDATFNGLEDRLFVFEYEAPPGWNIFVSPQYQEIQLDAVKIKPEKVESLKVIARPKVEQVPEEYDIKFTIKAADEDSDLQETVELKAIVKPVGDLVFTTETGRLNTEVLKDADNNYVLILDNIGTGPVEDITLSVVDSPARWLIDFKNEKIQVVDVGQPENIEVNIIPAEKTIAGDYMIRIMAQSEKSTTHIDVRATVKVPLVWQIAGIAIIVVVIVGMGFLFYRLGKR